ncbi:hypothetical protein [Tautonia rosea]|uniref:hypothetical protein n=1 Tax=Tautonia rosea TaxID=2728037 RepID=UPI001475182E|nr:hypothetical protein [Tautonia rosea]
MRSIRSKQLSRWVLCSMLGGAVALVLLSDTVGGAHPPQDADSSDPRALLGTWKVDLRPTPDAEPNYKEFEVKAVDGNTFSGTFYGTDFEEGRINADWDVVFFAFVTEDASGAYNHSGALRDGAMEGLSHSLGRNFLSVWRATKVESRSRSAHPALPRSERRGRSEKGHHIVP